MKRTTPTAQLSPFFGEAEQPSSGFSEQPERAERIARFKHLTEAVLPQLAREGRWPLRLDHCFKRVCLDYAFHDIWYRHLKKPAERHIDGKALSQALACAEAIALHGVPLLQQRNRESLGYRGKLKN